MAKYDLAVRGMADFTRLQSVLDQKPISRDPLSGILDSVNTVFHANYYPVLTTGSFGIYVNNALVTGTANYDTGEVILSAAPASQPFANYTYTPFTARQILSFTIGGFTEMEGRWSRGWQLLDGTGAWADEDSANVYVTDGSGNDPTAGSTVFSASRAQIGFLMACAEYRYAKSTLLHSAVNDYMWRESVRGMTVDKSRAPANLKLAADVLLENLMAAMAQAEVQYYPGGDQYGGYSANPATVDYLSNFEWQADSKASGNYVGALGFNISYRSLTYP